MDKKIVYAAASAAVLIAAGWFYTTIPTEADTGKVLVEVKVPKNLEGNNAGKTAFDENCASCHGENGAGVDGSGPPLIHKIYEPNHHGDMSFQMAAKNGVRAHHWKFGNMPPVEGIKDSEVTKIISYIRALQRANGIN